MPYERGRMKYGHTDAEQRKQQTENIPGVFLKQAKSANFGNRCNDWESKLEVSDRLFIDLHGVFTL